LFGVGFCHSRGPFYIEYRRAYILVSVNEGSEPATLVIRNNSYFFGRDRLPAPVYVSWEPLSRDALQNITQDDFKNFVRWQDILQSTPQAARAGKLRRVERLLQALDRFEEQFNIWLRSPEADAATGQSGLGHLVSFLENRLSARSAGKPGPLPFLGEVKAGMPSWNPAFSVSVTPELVSQLAALKSGGILADERLERLFKNGGTQAKLVLLTGKDGDYPLPPARPSGFQNPSPQNPIVA
jgi:hypothetical protein